MQDFAYFGEFLDLLAQLQLLLLKLSNALLQRVDIACNFAKVLDLGFEQFLVFPELH